MISAKKAGEIILESGVLERIEDYCGVFPEVNITKIKKSGKKRSKIWEFSCWKSFQGEVTNIVIAIGSNYWVFCKRTKKGEWYLFEYHGKNIEENALKLIIKEIKEFCIRELACRVIEVLKE